MKARTTALLALACFALPGCATRNTSAQAAPSPARHAYEKQGLAFATARCSGCHALNAGISPNPQAPAFSAIINQPGLTSDTLEPWLRNSHDFPAEMNFTIEQRHITDLAAYMLTLKDPAFRPAPQ